MHGDLSHDTGQSSRGSWHLSSGCSSTHDRCHLSARGNAETPFAAFSGDTIPNPELQSSSIRKAFLARTRLMSICARVGRCGVADWVGAYG